jgi:hypothetical protein
LKAWPRPPCIKARRFPQQKAFQDALPFAGQLKS